jgi:hypothetical protein
MQITRIEIVNGKKIDGFQTDLYIADSLYRQFKKDCAALYSRIFKIKVTVLLTYRTT